MNAKKHRNGVLNTLVEHSRVDIHRLKNVRAAYRLLIGALLTGNLNIEDNKVKDAIKNLERTEGISNNQFLKSSEFIKDLKGDAVKTIIAKNNRLNEINASIAQKKILFIEDNFKQAGWENVFGCIFDPNNIISASDEFRSSQLLDTYKYDIACVFLDLRLPDTEEQGLDILKNIKTGYPEIPVIVFSASDSVVYSKRAFELGAWDFFPKEPNDSVNRDPVDYFNTFLELMEKLSSYINNFTKKYWDNIFRITVFLKNYEKEAGSGLLNIVQRELEKAYKHLIFAEMYIYLPSFLNMEHYDEVIFCSSKAFECSLIFFTLYNKINTKKFLKNYYGDDGALTAKIVKEDILDELKGLGKLIDNIDAKQALSKLWVKKAYNQVEIRNKVIHGYRQSNNWKTSETKPTDKNVALKYLSDILSLIDEILKNLK